MNHVTWKQVAALFVALGSICHLTVTVIEVYGDARPAMHCATGQR